MARQPAGGRRGPVIDPDRPKPRPAASDALWESVRVDPVEIALPGGVGYTLRAYRLETEVAGPDLTGREDPDDQWGQPDAPLDRNTQDDDVDDEPEPEPDEAESPDPHGYTDSVMAQELADARRFGDEHNADADTDDSDADPSAAPPAPQEVPLFLSQGARLLLFRSERGLVDFVTSTAGHDLTQLDTWPALMKRVKPRDITPRAEDSYELDLVVTNLRGGRDSWDPDLLIKAGEVARDLGYAMRLPALVSAMSPGSPLDDLDEALRAASAGGVGGFLGRRKLRKIGVEAAPLAWRSIIGKISSVVDWRD